MKLAELNPRWVTLLRWASDSPFYIGITFECPHCRKQRLGVGFYPPIDPDNMQKNFEWKREFTPVNPVWNRVGDTFDTLSLSPSVDASAVIAAGHWHGNITNGECLP